MLGAERLISTSQKFKKKSCQLVVFWSSVFVFLNYLSSDKVIDCFGFEYRWPDSSNWYKCAEMPLSGQVGQIATFPLIRVWEMTETNFKTLLNKFFISVDNEYTFQINCSDSVQNHRKNLK